MIREDYCSFEVAKLLKEKGFAKDMIISDVWYDADGISYVRGNYSYSGAPFYDKETCFNCPTHQMAMKWLREVHNLCIEIYVLKIYDKKICEYAYTIMDLDFPGSDDGIDCCNKYKTYEEAVEAALKYCLENLI